MLDLTGILFSSIMMLLVIFRAVQLDAMLPWFRPLKTGTDSSGLRLRPEDQAPASPDARPSGARSSDTRSSDARMGRHAARGRVTRTR